MTSVALPSKVITRRHLSCAKAGNAAAKSHAPVARAHSTDTALRIASSLSTELSMFTRNHGSEPNDLTRIVGYCLHFSPI